MYRNNTYYRNRSKRFDFPFRKSALLGGLLLAVLAPAVIGITNAGKTSDFTRLDDRAKALTASLGGAAERNHDSRTSATAQAGLVGASVSVGLPMIAAAADLSASDKKEIAMRLVSSAENSSVDWRAQYAYIENIGDGRGYTAGIIGFCSGTGDMLELVQNYTKAKPSNVLAGFLSALRKVNGSDSTAGLGLPFVAAWKLAAADPAFQQAQQDMRDEMYFKPAVAMAKADGLGVLWQFMYYDAAVMHGPDAWGGGLPDIRAKAIKAAATPAGGGNEKVYLQAFLNARKVEMAKESAHRDVSRINDVQEAFLQSGNMTLSLPLHWKVYGDPFSISSL